jgi:hypothetical protein
VVQHLLGEVAGGGLDPEVAEHGIRLPSAQELDVVGVDAGAQQGGGSAGAEGAGAEEVRRDARGRLEERGGIAEGVGDVLRLDRVPGLMSRVVIVMRVYRGIGSGPIAAETEGYASERFGRAVERVRVGAVSHLFASHGILLVRKAQGRMSDALHKFVIQRCRGAVGGGAVDREGDVAVQKGLGPAILIGGAVQIFGGTQEPVVRDNDEVDEMGIEGAVFSVVDIEGIQEASEDGEVCRVGPSGRVVFVAEAFEERSEYWIVSEGSVSFLSGIASTHVGDPLAHRLEGFLDRITSDRLFGAWGVAVAQSEDHEVAQLVGATRDVREIRGVAVLLAEGGPSAEEGIVGFACLSGSGLGGVLQSSAEISLETCLDCR